MSKSSGNFKNTMNIVFGFIVLIAGCVVVFWVFSQVSNWYVSLNSTLQAGIITAIPIITVAIITYYANKSLETKRSVELAMRPKKLELYTDFNAFFMRIFSNGKVTKAPTETEITKYFVEKTPELITFASNAVIAKWGKLRIGLANEASNEKKMFLVEDVLKEIRVDLGHSNRGFKQGDILRLFVNDIDNFLKK